MNKALGCRYFSLNELKEASRRSDRFLTALIDSPFQGSSGKKGLMKILAEWKWEKHQFAKDYESERAEVDILIKRCLELSVDAVIIARCLGR
jgi:hypothetical protein